MERPQAPYFRYAGRGVLTAKSKTIEPTTAAGRLWAQIRRIFIGRPLASEEEVDERLSKKKALAIMSSDAISSSAYASEEILRVLVLAGAGALFLTFQLSLAIAALLAIVAISYRQICFGYPSGGGAYAVASANLPRIFALIAAAALTVDYIMTVAVSTSSAVEQIYSAIPALYDTRVEVSVVAIGIIVIGNLRGIRESGNIFALPTYMYVVTALLMVGIGIFKIVVQHDPAATGYHAANVPSPIEPLGIALLLHAFASGSVALTGTEAIANGVPVFKRPEPRNAANTLMIMAGLLAVLFVGVSWMAVSYGVLPIDQPVKQSVPSLLAHISFGDGPLFYLFQAATALILLLASNTSFNAFPRLAAILAEDGYLPRQFAFRGDRLAFSIGILLLGGVAAILMVAFKANTNLLIPLYSVGVFISFTISQGGMVRHWYEEHGRGWQGRLAINALGMLLTGVVAVVVATEKFAAGAWLVILLIPALVFMMLFVRRQYRVEERELRVRDDMVFGPPHRRQRVILPVSGLNRAVVQAVAFGRTLSDDVRVLYVTDDVEAGERLRERFEHQLPGIQFVIIESPYRQLLGPIASYLDVMDHDPELITIVVLPERVSRHWWERLLHNRNATRLRQQLVGRPNTVVASVPYRRDV